MKKIITLIIITFITLSFSIKDIKAEELPKVYFEGNIKNMTSKEDERKIKLTYVSNDLNFEAYTLIKVQGTSSLAYEKKNYTIKLYEDKEYKNKKKIDVGFGKENKYCLKANWIDKTHARNIVTARITSSIQEKYTLFTNTPNNGLIDGFPVEIYINNKFLGIYTWNIPKDAWMFNMDEDNPNHIVLSGETYTNATYFKDYATFDDWEVEVGPKTEETLEKFNRVLEFIFTSTDEEFKQNFENYLNLDATLNYFVMLNIAQLFDNTSKNMLMVTYDGKIWYPSLYDLDTSWGTNWNGLTLFNYKTELTSHAELNLLWTKFERVFSTEIAERYFELKKEILTKENILNEFNNFINSIPESSWEKENNRWNNIPGYDINQIEEFLDIRIPLIDKSMYNLYTTIPTVNTKYSTTKYTIKPVEVTLIPNRNDITIYKDGKIVNDYTYTFKQNGEYNFEYKDGNGNTGTLIIKVDWIFSNKLVIISIAIIIITITVGLTYYNSYKKETQNNKQSNNQIQTSNTGQNNNPLKETKKSNIVSTPTKKQKNTANTKNPKKTKSKSQTSPTKKEVNNKKKTSTSKKTSTTTNKTKKTKVTKTTI